MSALSASMERWKFLCRIFAARAHSLQRYFVDVGGVARGIDLNVFAAGVDQLGDHLTLDLDDMLDKVVEPFVDI